MGRLPFMLLAVLVGAAAVVQSRVNGAIGVITGDGATVALLTFSVGLILTGSSALLAPRVRRAIGELKRSLARGSDRNGIVDIRPWHLLGGLGGATFVTSQGISVPVVGVAVFTVAVVAGQTGNALVVDRLGLGPAGRQSVTVIRVLAALLALAGVALSVADDFGSASFSIAAVGLALVAGGLITVQQAINARVGHVAGSPFVAGITNFVVGFAALLLLVVIRQLLTGASALFTIGNWFEPWMLTGGLLGASFIVSAALVLGRLGVLLFALLTITGQVSAALLLTIFLPLPGEMVTPWLIAGVLVTGAAVALATVNRAALRSRAARTPEPLP